MILLLDSNILIDAIRGRNFAAFKAAVASKHQLAISAVSLGEIYAGTLPQEEERTGELIGQLECYSMTAAICRHAGELVNSWGRMGRTFKLPDMMIAATAIDHRLALMTANRKDFPMPELTFYPPDAS